MLIKGVLMIEERQQVHPLLHIIARQDKQGGGHGGHHGALFAGFYATEGG
jgi:hypothetical protein